MIAACLTMENRMKAWSYGIAAFLLSNAATFFAAILWTAPVDAGPNPVPMLATVTLVVYVASFFLLRMAFKSAKAS